MYRYVIIDGFKYAVQQGTYVRKWQRQFTATLVANIVELNFIDKGPGVKTYDFTLHVATWDPSSQPYQDGITQPWNVQMANLEASYAKIATAMPFVDPLGQSPGLGAVYFTSLVQNIPPYSTVQKPYLLVDIEVVSSVPGI